MKSDRQVGERGYGISNWIRNIFGARGNDHIISSRKSEWLVGGNVNFRFGRRNWAGDVNRSYVQRHGSKSVRQIDAQDFSANRQVNNLAHGCVTQIVRAQRIVWLGDLLRRGP